MVPGRGSGCYAGFEHPQYVYSSLNLRCPFITYSEGNSLHCNHFYQPYTLWAGKKNFCHLERSYLLLLCGIGYNVVKWSHCEFKRDLLYFFLANALSKPVPITGVVTCIMCKPRLKCSLGSLVRLSTLS